jgi:2-(1,2-epoxy-1,2-dihydrophenyl)acetyl-CoA isomerase
MSAITTHDEGRVRYIVLNRAEKMNALNNELAWGYVNALEAAARDDDVWIIGVTGSGRAFCAGLDLTGAGDTSSTPLPPLSLQLDDLSWVSRLLLVAREQCDKPVVAGINGVAVGAGLSLAMSADIRIMKRSARLMAGYPRIGGSPDGGLSYTLPEAMNYEQGIRFLLENRTVEGDEALKLGLVGEVVDDDQFEERFKAYCQSLTKLSPITARLTKRVVKQATVNIDLAAQLRYELSNIRMAFSSEDGQEARRAFLERRDPVFKGR